jgi:F0F1-type ATP synthase assembly protein I
MSTDARPTSELATAAHRSAGSFELVFAPVLMALIGLLIDSWAGTRPLFTVLFTLWGAAGAAVGLYFRYRREAQAAAEQRSQTAAARAASAAAVSVAPTGSASGAPR